MVPKLFDPLKFDCMLLLLYVVTGRNPGEADINCKYAKISIVCTCMHARACMSVNVKRE